MDIDTKKEVFAVFKTGADHDSARSMNNLGMLYNTGQGVGQDYAQARGLGNLQAPASLGAKLFRYRRSIVTGCLLFLLLLLRMAWLQDLRT